MPHATSSPTCMRFVNKKGLVNKRRSPNQTHYPHRNCDGVEEYPLGLLCLLSPGSGIPQMEHGREGTLDGPALYGLGSRRRR